MIVRADARRRWPGMILSVASVLMAYPLWTATAAGQIVWQAEEVLRIGAVDGPAALTPVGAIVISPDGTSLVVTQPQESRIRIMDAKTGQPRGVFGRRGAGPAEFQAISHIGWRSDTLVVTDKLSHRIALFSMQGVHLATRQVALGIVNETRFPAVVAAVAPNGGIWAESASFNISYAARSGSADSPIFLVPVGATTPRPVANRSLGSAHQGDGAVFMQPWSQRTVSAYAPDGSHVVVVDAPFMGQGPSEFTLTRVSESGDTTLRRTYRYTPRVVAPTIRDSLLTSYALALYRRAGTPARALEVARRNVAVPQTEPPITSVVVGLDGSIVLRREERPVNGRRTHILIDAAGTLKGYVQLPAPAYVLAVQGDMLWGTVHDELNVPFIVAYRVRSHL